MNKFNSDLNKKFNNTQLDDHIKEVKSNIKSIFKSTKGSLELILEETKKIKINDYITNLKKNYDSLNKFDKYNQEKKLMKIGAPIKSSKLKFLPQIYMHLDNYKRTLKSRYSDLEPKLTKLKTKLTVIQNTTEQICTKIHNYTNDNGKMPEVDEIDKLLVMALFLKQDYIDKLDEDSGFLYTLGRIDSSISYLKAGSSIDIVELDEDYRNAVKSLERINIIPNTILSSMDNIKTQIDNIIAELELTKFLLKYMHSIKVLIIDRVCGSEDVMEFLKDSLSIIKTWSETSKKIDQLKPEIDKITTQKGYLKAYVPTTLDNNVKKYKESIKKFVDNGIINIKMIRVIVYNLLIVMDRSVFENINNKINQINSLNSSLENFKEIYSYITGFYYFQLKTMFLVNYYYLMLDKPGDVKEALKKLNEIILELNNLTYLITYYYTILYHIRVIVKRMDEVKNKVNDLNQFKKNSRYIKSFIRIIISKLADLNRNITQLKCDTSGINPNNLKDKIMNYKDRVKIIKTHIEWLIKTLSYTKTYIEKTVKELDVKCKEITREIQKSINYLLGIISVEKLLSIPKYLMSSQNQNPITTVLSEIKKYLEILKGTIEDMMKSIEIILNYISLNILLLKALVVKISLYIYIIGGSVADLECSIEGVARNIFICSLKLMSTHITIYENSNPPTVNNSISNVIDNNVVTSRLNKYPFKIDRMFQINHIVG